MTDIAAEYELDGRFALDLTQTDPIDGEPWAFDRPEI